MELKKNDIVELDIGSVTSQGSGVGRTKDGVVVFVPLTAVGDRLKVKILKTKKSYAYGKIQEIISPSADRTEPDCPCFEKCGGCVYRHISYNSELEIKYNRVRDALERVGGFKDAKINPVEANDKVDRYRNKAQLPAQNCGGNIQLGFYASHTHRIVSCEDCLLQPPVFKTVMDVTKDFMDSTNQKAYDENTGKGRLRHLYIRYAQKTDELMVCYVVNANGLKQEEVLINNLRQALPNLKSVIINSNRENTNVILGAKNRTAYGQGYITDELCSLKFKLSPLSFYQVNRTQAKKLYSIVKGYAGLKGGEVLLDLYCGTGTIGLTLASSCKRLIGVEIVREAIADAEENARLNNIDNASFICGDASTAANKLQKEGITPDVVIIDPPRKGCDSRLIDVISRMKPRRIVYVSCDPETLARDLREFTEKNYSLREITPVDLFSRTAHIECAALLIRG